MNDRPDIALVYAKSKGGCGYGLKVLDTAFNAGQRQSLRFRPYGFKRAQLEWYPD
jgi:hypothetical protein